MSLMDMDALTAAFKSHTEGHDKFTRRMAIVLAGMDGTTPKQLIQRCERLGLLKPGSWEWFKDNGGITAEQVDQVRHETTLSVASDDHATTHPQQEK